MFRESSDVADLEAQVTLTADEKEVLLQGLSLEQ